MKRTFVRFSMFAAIAGVVLTSCNNEEANKKAQEADDLAVQALVAAKELGLETALAAEWDAKILAAAEAKAAELAAAAKKGVKLVVKKPAAPVAKKEEPKTPVNPKANKFGGNGSVTEEQTQQKANKFESQGGQVKVTEEQTQKKKDKFK